MGREIGIERGLEIKREREGDRQRGINNNTSRYRAGWIQRARDREIQRDGIIYYTASQASWGLKSILKGKNHWIHSLEQGGIVSDGIKGKDWDT